MNDAERPKVEVHSQGKMMVLVNQVYLKKKPPYRLKTHQWNILMVNNDTVLTVMRRENEIYDVLQTRIQYPGSKVRLNGPHFLIYAMVDAIVDSIFPIVKIFHNELRQIQNRVHSSGKFEYEYVQDVQRVYREMSSLVQWLKPIRAVVTRLHSELPKAAQQYHTEQHGGGEYEARDLRRYLNDLRDHVETLQEQAQGLQTWTKSMNDDYMNAQQNQMNKVMYALTLVTTVFVPAQFVTGVYGMNFKYMPELNYKWSYAIFWVLCIVFSGAMVLYFKLKKWI